MTAVTNSGYLQVGALAGATGLTVRTLHHYDAIGLLVPEERSPSGRRLYSPADVRRLYRIVALRQLGLSLDDIAAILDRDSDLAGAIREHLTRVEATLAAQRRLQLTLSRMLEALEHQRDPALDQFVQAIEEITMIEKYYTLEQQEQLAARAQDLGLEGIRQAEREWAELIDAVAVEKAAGTAPSDPRMLGLARQWRRLIEQFTGGDDGIRESLTRMYREEGSKEASRSMVDPDLMSYVNEALAALRATE